MGTVGDYGTAAVRKEMGGQHPDIMVLVDLSHFRGIKMEKDKKNHKETSSCSAGFSHRK